MNEYEPNIIRQNGFNLNKDLSFVKESIMIKYGYSNTLYINLYCQPKLIRQKGFSPLLDMNYDLERKLK